MLRGDNARLGRVPASLSDCMADRGAFGYALKTDEWGRQSAVVDTNAVDAFCGIIDAVDGGEESA